MEMTIRKLVTPLKGYDIKGDKSIKINGITDDSREVKRGYLFVAISGIKNDGHDYIDESIKKGAKAILYQKNIKKFISGVVYIKVKDSRKALALISSEWFGNPSHKLKIIGITGTDGKTTTASLISWILNSSGIKTGLISTLGAQIGNRNYDTGLHVTTPEPLDLHRFLSLMTRRGCKVAVLEVTSHAIQQERIYGIDFSINVLTNITNEHLDYHKSFDNYMTTKVRFLNSSDNIVINKKDRSYRKVLKRLDKDKIIFPYPQHNLNTKIIKSIKNRFQEEFNRLNAEAAVIAVRYLGVNYNNIVSSIKIFPNLRGRLENIKNNRSLSIFVDFAHTPNALKNVLTELRKDCKGRMVVVFGCAGERDVKKRPVMGETAGRYADFSIITAEDPRHEKVDDIIIEIENGIKKTKIKKIESIGSNDFHEGKSYYTVIPDRGKAIYTALNRIAKGGDTVVICGKGHEISMCYEGTEFPWSDHEAVNLALKGKMLNL